MANVGYATLSVLPSAKGFGSALSSEIGGQMPSIGKGAGAGFMSGFRGSAVGVAAAAGVAVASAVAGGLYSVGGVFKEMSNTIQISTGASGAALDSLVDSATAVGTSVPVEFGKASDAIASLNTFTGATGETLEGMAASVLDASRLLGEDGVSNAEAFGQALTQFSRPAEDGAAIMDSLFVATQDYGLGLGEVIGQLNTYGSVLQNAGFSMEESAHLFGQLNTAGLSVSRIMPGLNSAFRNWASEGKNVQAELGNTVDAIANAEDSTQALAIATDAFGAEGAQRLTTAIRSGRFELEGLGDALANADGAIAESSAATRTLGDNWQLLSNRVLDALEPLGSAVHGAVTDMSTAFVESGALETALDWVKGFGESVTGVLEGVDLGGFFATLGEALSPVIDAFSELGPTIAEVAGPALEALMAVSPLRMIFEALAPVLPALAEAFGSLAESAIGALSPLLPIVTEVAVIVGEALAEAFQIVGPVIAQLVPIVGDLLAGAFEAITPILEMAPGLLDALLPPILSLIPVVLQIVEALTPVVSIVGDLIGSLLPPLVDLFISLWPPVAELVAEVASALVPALDIFSGLLSGVVIPILGTLIGWVGNVIGIIVELAGPIIGGLVSALGTAIGWFGNIIGWVSDFFRILGNVGGAIGNFVSSIASGIGDAVQWFRDLPGRVLDAISGLASRLLDAGRNVVQGFIDGVRAMAGNVISAITSTITDALPSFVRSALGISSPSKLFRSFGQDTAAGMALGIEDGADDVRRAAEALVPPAPSIRAPEIGTSAFAAAARGAGGPRTQTFNIHETSDARGTAHTVARMLARAG